MSPTFFKAVHPDGASFNDPAFHWNTEPGGVTRHPLHPCSMGKRHWTDACEYLSVSTEAGDCTGMRWPARLLIVEPVEGVDVWAPDLDSLPHKRASVAWRTVREGDPVALLGPNGSQVAVYLALLPTLTPEQWAAASDAARDAARAAASGAARAAAWAAASDARDAARAAASDAARDAARAAASGAARAAAWAATRAAAWAATWAAASDARDAARALVVRDLITPDQFATLTAPMRAAGIDFDRMEMTR